MNIAELVDGGNFEVIPGKHDKSKLVIHENVAYKVGKVTQKEGSKIYYLKCKFGSCPSRAQIRGGFLSLSPSFKAHTCSSEGASQSTWSALEAIAKMKVRAMKETSTPLVIFILYLALVRIFIKAHLCLNCNCSRQLFIERIRIIVSFSDNYKSTLIW